MMRASVTMPFKLCLVLFLALFLMLPVAARAAGSVQQQRTFSSPEEAQQALVSAVEAKDHRSQLAAIFGPTLQDLESGDPVEDETEFQHFAGHVREGVGLVKEGEDKATLQIGSKKWPFPIPLVKKGDGWLFDTQAGREEIVTRRIGHNELSAINACRSYVEAQREYYDMPVPDGVPIPKYAQHMISRPGRHDGLYWPTVPGEKESPLGLQVAKAKEKGYMLRTRPGEEGPKPFHGYYFKILKKQGKSAPGGKFDYVINGNMVAGYALVAYPARWGVSGVMTFIVNQSGRVYQKNLGPKTGSLAKKITEFNPDRSWKLVTR